MQLPGRSKKNQQAVWRPDFRSVENLPDTKAVRTGFLYNFIAITVTVGLLVYLGLQEYNIHSAGQEVIRLQSQLESGTAQNRQLLELNRQWLGHANVVKEAVQFHRSPLNHADFLRELTEALPEGIVFSSISLTYAAPAERNARPFMRIALAGQITGGTDRSPSQVLTNLQAMLNEQPQLSGQLAQMTVIQFVRDNALNVFNFALELQIEPLKPL